MSAPFHEGELAVQRRAGVEREASAVGGSIHAAMPPRAQAFLLLQPFAILGAAGAGDRVWASALTGRPGFLAPERDGLLTIHAVLPAGDPLVGSLLAGHPVGLLVIEFATRRRMRLNGRIASTGDVIRIATDQVYSNCPKYIQPRELVSADAPTAPEASHGTVLTRAQRAWIAAADTFFIASRHPEAGVDASHRGGPPGFVRTIDDRTLAWDDFVGNAMFQTLGNLAVDPRAGLLFIAFEQGHTLQITGRAETLWQGTERSVRFAVEEIIETRRVLPVRWASH